MNQPSQSPDTSQRRRGVWLVFAAALLWSLSGLFVKSETLRGWPGPTIAFWRAAFASVVLLPLVRQPRWSWWLVPMVLAFAAMNYTYLTALTQTSAANAIWLQYTAPAWVFLVGVFCLREPVQRGDVGLFVLSTLGVAVILGFELSRSLSPGVIYGVLGGVFFACVVLSLRKLRELDAAWLVALNHIGAAVLLAPLAYGHGEPWPAGNQWLFLAGLGVLQMGLPYVLFARGLRSVTGHEASGIGLIEPLLVPLWVYLSSGESPAWWTVAGASLILLGLVFRYLRLLA